MPFFICSPLFVIFPLSCLDFPSRASKCALRVYFSHSFHTSIFRFLPLSPFSYHSSFSTLNAFCCMCIPLSIPFFTPSNFPNLAHLRYFAVEPIFLPQVCGPDRLMSYALQNFWHVDKYICCSIREWLLPHFRALGHEGVEMDVISKAS